MKEMNFYQFQTLSEQKILFPDDDVCPVRYFKQYISRLNPKIDSLWQKPCKKGNTRDPPEKTHWDAS